MRTTVGPPAGLDSAACRRPRRPGRPARSARCRGRVARRRCPSSRTSTTSRRPSRAERDRRARSRRCAGRRWSAPRTTRSTRWSRRARAAAGQVEVDGDRDRQRRSASSSTARGQPDVGEHLRVDAADEARAARPSAPSPARARPRRRRRRVVGAERVDDSSRARPSPIASVTRRCWAPSCRSRSIRRRSVSKLSTSRVREAPTSVSSSASRWVRSASRVRRSRPTWKHAPAVQA